MSVAPGGAATTFDLLKLLYREDRKDEESRFGTQIIHASSFARMPSCARMLFLGNYLTEQGVEYRKPVFGATKLVWSYGRAAEKHVRENLLKDEAMRRAAWGSWRCTCGHTAIRGHLPASPPRCSRCRHRATNYHEGTLIDRVHGIAGNPDFVYLDGTRYRVVEIKSIKGTSTAQNPGFADTNSPQPTHVEQGVHYVRLFENEGMAVHPEPHILYVLKDFDPRQWYKLLTPTPAMLARAREDVDRARAMSRQYTEALAAGVCPPMIDRCLADNNALQSQCEVWAECIGRHMQGRAR